MEEKVYRGSAPGRLDFMGGVADYSGSLVLQIPIAAMVSAGRLKDRGELPLIRSGK